MVGGPCECDAPPLRPTRKTRPINARNMDYLYDSAYIVSGARDYARTAFRAAMGTSQMIIQPVYKTMFSELRKFPRFQVVYHPNCRLPQHMDTSYRGYLNKMSQRQDVPSPDLTGKDRFKFSAWPRKVLDLKTTSPDFHPPTPLQSASPGKPLSRGTQSMYRESSAQTTPWQPDAKPAKDCEKIPEVFYLDNLQWGPGKPYRTGDLPVDFHTCEIINKMRHARIWYEVAERGKYPRWMKKRDDIIKDVETKDWIFREAEIDELQEIRLELLHKLQNEQRANATNKTSTMLAKRWANNKTEMERKINRIRKSRDREIRKLEAIHHGGGRLGAVQRLRAARAMGCMTLAAADPTSDLYAPVARHGYQARGRHAVISYDPSLLLMEDHTALAQIPQWLEQCGQDLTKTCSGHHLPRDPMKLCERESKWSEDFLAKLHNDLKLARMGAAAVSAGPLHILKPRRLQDTPRPVTPQMDSVPDCDENQHQSALVLQRIIRGRAVQCLMYEGRTRAAELTEELKTTHGLQTEDKIRIAKEEAKSRDFKAISMESEKKEDAITALVDELCGGAVSAALDFLEKELRRLKEERKQHAFIMIALREKQMREAAEAGRRQKEEQRRREHDEMFKQVLGVTQDTVESYLEHIILEGVELSAEEEAVRLAIKRADKIDEEQATQTLTTAEEHELVAELVQQFLLPAAHKAAAKKRIEDYQNAKLEAARTTIFGLLDVSEIRKTACSRCGNPMDGMCRCLGVNMDKLPEETIHRQDPRWIHTKKRPPRKRMADPYPASHDFRCMLDTLVDEAVVEARRAATNRDEVKREYLHLLKENLEKEIEAKGLVDVAIDIATGALKLPLRESTYHHFHKLIRKDALERTEPVTKQPCPKELPSAIRYKAEVEAAKEDGCCRCKEEGKVIFGIDPRDPVQRKTLLPSKVRELEELRRCKCDTDTSSEAKEEEKSIVTDTTDIPPWSFTEDDDATTTATHDDEPKMQPEETDDA